MTAHGYVPFFLFPSSKVFPERVPLLEEPVCVSVLKYNNIIIAASTTTYWRLHEGYPSKPFLAYISKLKIYH